MFNLHKANNNNEDEVKQGDNNHLHPDSANLQNRRISLRYVILNRRNFKIQEKTYFRLHLKTKFTISKSGNGRSRFERNGLY